MVVGGEAAGWSGPVGGFVVPDRGGEGEDALEDAGDDALGFSPAAAFEVELGFEGLVDRFDDLTERSQESLQGAGFLCLVCGSDQGDPCVGESLFKDPGAVALVSNERLSGPVQGGVDNCRVACRVADLSSSGPANETRHLRSSTPR